MRICKTLKSNRKFNIARANYVLNLEVLQPMGNKLNKTEDSVIETVYSIVKLFTALYYYCVC